MSSKSTVDHQSLETKRALTNQSVEYRLSEEAQYLASPTAIRCQWSNEGRMKYIKFVRSLGKSDMENQKTIDTINWENKESDFRPAKLNLSIKLSGCLSNVLQAEIIERKTVNLLNHPASLVLFSTPQVTEKKK